MKKEEEFGRWLLCICVCMCSACTHTYFIFADLRSVKEGATVGTVKLPRDQGPQLLILP